MILGTVIGLCSIFLIGLAFALCATASRYDRELEIIERKHRPANPTEPEHPGVVLKFARRK